MEKSGFIDINAYNEEVLLRYLSAPGKEAMLDARHTFVPILIPGKKLWDALLLMRERRYEYYKDGQRDEKAFDKAFSETFGSHVPELKPLVGSLLNFFRSDVRWEYIQQLIGTLAPKSMEEALDQIEEKFARSGMKPFTRHDIEISMANRFLNKKHIHYKRDIAGYIHLALDAFRDEKKIDMSIKQWRVLYQTFAQNSYRIKIIQKRIEEKEKSEGKQGELF